jgi:hypothetical protein
MEREDADSEVIRRNNAAAKVKPKNILLAGLSTEAEAALSDQLPHKRLRIAGSISEVRELIPPPASLSAEPITWGRDKIGLGLLAALRANKTIEFTEAPSPTTPIPSISGHLVVCEEGDDLSQVIAANYAYALDAGLCLIPEVPDQMLDKVTEAFYSLNDPGELSPSAKLEALKNEIAQLCSELPIPVGGSITFITGGIPYGFAVTDVPTTHLFIYPNLGITIIDGFAAEQPNANGIGVAVLVDPEEPPGGDMLVAAKALLARNVMLQRMWHKRAHVSSVSRLVELFPYDLLIIATHCGDVSGWRWTYQFKDREGIDRTFVVDVGIGIGRTNDPDLLAVTQFLHFVSLDGVDWHDPVEKEKLYVGTAIQDFFDRTRSEPPQLEPIEKVVIPRVAESSALKMYDNNYIAVPSTLADNSSPIIICNACVSWRRLSKTFLFGGARAYISTLFEILPSEAQSVTEKLLGKRFGKPLPLALWRAQREISNEGLRRPYIMFGVYTQFLRPPKHQVVLDLVRRLKAARAVWQKRVESTDDSK